MSDIDDVIRRSREPGQFSERKEFTIAKDRAIEKMRKFALKTPSHYILEIIQGAVANGATYIDIFVDIKTTRVAWTGGVFSLEELQQIFDFLFSDNEDKESVAIRQLAVGVNALLSFKPRQIIIESGDGTIENSTRIEIDPRTMHITAGRPKNPLKGTFILAEKKKGKSQEIQLIGERCLTLNIPIIVNDQILFGYSSIRSPNLLGVKRSLKFDEGDFYGTIGLSRGSNTDNFKILTHGVWIQTVKRSLNLPQKFGGIIAFDSLNKTVDHAAIVEDERWNEMWARVTLLARELISGANAKEISIKLNGEWTDLSICRKKAAQAGGAILFQGDAVQKLIPEYEKIYGFPGFFVRSKDFTFVSDLLGNQNLYIAAGTQEELDFLRKPKVGKPSGPFFLPPLSVPNTVVDVEIVEIDRVLTSSIIFDTKKYTADLTIYTPRSLELTTVEFVERGRLVSSTELPNFAPGFRVRAHLAPEHSNGWIPNPRKVRQILDKCSVSLRELSGKIANDYVSVIEPNTSAAFHVLRAISSTTVFSIDNGIFSIRRLGVETNAILDAPILRTLDEEPKSILQIVDLMNTQFGLVYGCVSEISSDLSNLDKRKILSLTLQEENELISIFGDAAYVRVDERDILASHTDEQGKVFTIRDIAVGLGVYDSRFICCEDNENITIAGATSLIEKLKQRVLDSDDDPELRRQSLRHLIWILTHKNSPPALIEDLKNFPLFRSVHNDVVSYNQLCDEIEMLDGWPIGPIALPKINTFGTDKTKILALNPFVFHMLSRKKNISAQSNNVGNRADLRTSVLSTWIDNDNEKGTVSLMPRSANKTFSVINSATKRVHVHDAMASKLMCAGEFFTEKDNQLIDSFLLNSIQLFGKAADLINQSNELSHIHNLAEPALFGALSLIVMRRLGTYHRMSTRFPEIEKLLRCKIFPTKKGVPVSALTLTQSFENPIHELHENAPSYQTEWLDTILNSELINETQSLQEPKDWKEHFFLPLTLDTARWLVDFVRLVTNEHALFNMAPKKNQRTIWKRRKGIVLNRHVLSKSKGGRLWVVMEILSELYKINEINYSTLLDYHAQIAELILHRSKPENTSRPNKGDSS